MNELREEFILAGKEYIAKNYLLQIGKKVGDEVTWSFMHFHGNAKRCYQGLKTCKAIIKQREDRTIYIQSLEPCANAFEKWNGKFGRLRNTYWAFEEVFPTKELVEISCLCLKD